MERLIEKKIETKIVITSKDKISRRNTNGSSNKVEGPKNLV